MCHRDVGRGFQVVVSINQGEVDKREENFLHASLIWLRSLNKQEATLECFIYRQMGFNGRYSHSSISQVALATIMKASRVSPIPLRTFQR